MPAAPPEGGGGPPGPSSQCGSCGPNGSPRIIMSSSSATSAAFSLFSRSSLLPRIVMGDIGSRLNGIGGQVRYGAPQKNFLVVPFVPLGLPGPRPGTFFLHSVVRRTGFFGRNASAGGNPGWRTAPAHFWII